ncbi:hypothetical protein O3P69_016146 [Scylla paramamosain]|uniref:Uncharacterized protein n=1 Tax=Scylla paramamosain TaxID=85552 RepID=A0AAW0SG05_SCYPA
MKTDEGSPNKKMDNVNTATVLTIISQELDSSVFWELTDQEAMFQVLWYCMSLPQSGHKLATPVCDHHLSSICHILCLLIS